MRVLCDTRETPGRSWCAACSARSGGAGSGSQIQGAEVDLLQYRVERRRPVGEFVGGVGAEPGYVGVQVGRQGGELAGGDGPALGDQLADDVHDVQGVVEDDQVGQQGVELDQFLLL